jgi:hypothetical protein
MQHECGIKMGAIFWCRNLEKFGHIGDVIVSGRIILK